MILQYSAVILIVMLIQITVCYGNRTYLFDIIAPSIARIKSETPIIKSATERCKTKLRLHFASLPKDSAFRSFHNSMEVDIITKMLPVKAIMATIQTKIWRIGWRTIWSRRENFVVSSVKENIPEHSSLPSSQSLTPSKREFWFTKIVFPPGIRSIWTILQKWFLIF